MKEEHKKSLISYRLERANEALRAAHLLLENNMLTSAMNRIYYSMFYAVQSLLVLHNVSFSKHTHVKGYFTKEFINKGIFSIELGKSFNKIFEYRQKFDYVDLITPDQNIIKDNIKHAKKFINELTEYIKKQEDNL